MGTVSTARRVYPNGGSGYGRLDRRVILDAALRVAARPGAAEVHFRDLGGELGADPTAVYRHFRGKRELVEALIERLMEDVVHDVSPADDWRTVLSTMAAGLLERFTRHPAIGLHLADTRPVGAAELVLAELTLKALEDAGLREDALVRHYGALSGFSLSYVAMTCRELVTAGRSSAHGTDDMPWLPDDVEITAETHPTLLRYRESLATMSFRSTYFETMTVLIEAAAGSPHDR
jgi:AcrR family transcriptional regulator